MRGSLDRRTWLWLGIPIGGPAAAWLLWAVLSRSPDTTALEARVLSLMQSGNRRAARRQAELLVRIAPKSVFGNLALGSLAEAKGDFAEAASAYQRVAAGCGAGFLDYGVDSDSDLDLVTANGHVQDQAARIDSTASYAQDPLLLLNERGRFKPGTLIRKSRPVPPMVGRGLAAGDWNKDGRPDLLLVDAEGTPHLFRNECPTPAHWLGVKLLARRGDRDGRGAMLHLTVAGKSHLRHCHSDGSYLSANDPRVLFGLGAATKIDRLEVRWPSGVRTVRRSLPIDRYVTIEETP